MEFKTISSCQEIKSGMEFREKGNLDSPIFVFVKKAEFRFDENLRRLIPICNDLNSKWYCSQKGCDDTTIFFCFDLSPEQYEFKI